VKTKIESLKITDDVVYVNEIPFYREAVDLTKAKKVLEKWEWIKSHINNELADTQAAYDDLKKNGLSFNAIEAEGFLRALIDVRRQHDHIDEVID
jgi:hypothetical protein